MTLNYNEGQKNGKLILRWKFILWWIKKIPAKQFQPYRKLNDTDCVYVWSFSSIQHLAYWGLNKMADILQTIYSSTFSWMKIISFWFKFCWSLFLRVHLTICQHWFRSWLGTYVVPSMCLSHQARMKPTWIQNRVRTEPILPTWVWFYLPMTSL